MPTHLTQDLAALATSVLWSFSAMAWSLAGRRVGSVPVTAIRILLAAMILLAIHAVAFGSPWPLGLDGESVGLLAVSGLLGAFAADLCLFRGLVLIGPRQGMLVQSLGPILTSLIAYWGFGDGLDWRSVAGIALTVAGVAWVLAEQKGRESWKASRRDFATGVILCLVAVVVVSFGYVLSGLALEGGPRHFSVGGPLPKVVPFSGGLIRVAAAAVATVLFLPVMGRTRATLSALRDRRAMLVIIGGTIVGPVVGIWMSMIALAGNKSGVAVALINLTPLVLIPIVYLAYGEKPSSRALLGTLIALGGVCLLVMR